MEKEFSYKDIHLIPQKCIVNSRKDCNTGIKFGPKTFLMPVYPSNMKSVINEKTCEFMARNGYFYTMHRFGVDNDNFISNMHQRGLFASISIGIGKEAEVEINNLVVNNNIPEYITIDVANAWSEKCKKTIEYIRGKIDSFLIVGNVATYEAVQDLKKWGAQAIKVGIAGGKVCITKNKTGFSRPMVSTLLDCCKPMPKYGTLYCQDINCVDCYMKESVPIIADGGIEEHGDIAKALSCGASMVMAGYLFAGYDESAGEIIDIDNKTYKQYYGSASKQNKSEQRNIEGKKILIPYRGSMDRLLVELKEDLQSSISYAGGKDLSVFKQVQMAYS